MWLVFVEVKIRLRKKTNTLKRTLRECNHTNLGIVQCGMNLTGNALKDMFSLIYNSSDIFPSHRDGSSTSKSSD